MADSSPLLSRVNSSEPEAHPVLHKGPPTLDDAIEQCVGSFGPAQLIQAVLVSFSWVFDCQQTFINIFTDAQPSWHCTRANDMECLSAATPCELPKHAWAWDQPASTSIISQWDLMCSNPLISGLPASSFFAGCLAGGFLLSTLADSSLGRKKMLLLSCLTISVTGALTVASPNLWAYSALRFISGCGRATISTCALVLSTEIVGKQWRGEVGIFGFFCSMLGFLSLPAMAYLASGTSWWTLYLCTSVPVIFYCIAVHFLVHESPRWLFVRGRKDEAIQTLRSIALSNGKILLSSFSEVAVEEESWNVDIYSAMKILWEKKWAFRRLLMVMVVGFGVGMVYYGMPLGLGNLNFNLYLSVTFNALSELPSALLAFFLIGRMNRRSAVLVFTILSGLCSVLICMVIDGGDMKEVQMGLELVSFFSACTAFNRVLIYTLELFPTSVRSSALSMVRQTIAISGVISPLLVVAGRNQGSLSFGVFGVVIGGGGLFVMGLPETRGGPSCDTMEEEEKKEILNFSGDHE
ncbi:organic cation/carnitine transporter 3-like [Magnolia sinica]|uniref:organic cation/carnitine transporter 3-like n=1 Tax=Magnolia sinica TaxID=86752 RepID=UPI002657EED9|nr:organic cation/carnitine transporter 3-like [Magnolia sinica]